MKQNLKHIVIFCSAVAIISGLFFANRLSSTTASDNYHETLRISPSSLNGNSIWGENESFNAVISAGGFDERSSFYSSSNKTYGGLETSGSLSINSIPYKFSWTGEGTYDGNDVIRLYNNNRSAQVNFETVGAYEQIHILGTASGIEEGNLVRILATLNYTDGTTETNDVYFSDLYDSTPNSNIDKYSNLAIKLNTDYEGTTTGAPYLQSTTINTNSKKLLKSLDIEIIGKNDSDDISGLFVGIYAVTGTVNMAAPNPIEAIIINEYADTSASISWNNIIGATSYRLDIATDSSFMNILPNYNNIAVDGSTIVVNNLNPETRYFARVRAENVNGQSISSDSAVFDIAVSTNKNRTQETTISDDENVEAEPKISPLTTENDINYEAVNAFECLINDEMPEAENLSSEHKDIIEEAISLYDTFTDNEKEVVSSEVIEKYNEIVNLYYYGKPELLIIGDTDNWKVSDIIEITASDISGIEGIYILKGENNWEKLTSFNSIAYEVRENGNLIFKAVDSFGNETTKNIIHTNIDSIKPVVELNASGYEIGTWTNENVIIKARNTANNISPVTVYASINAEDWEEYLTPILHTEDTTTSGTSYYFKAVSEAGQESDIVEGNVKKDSVFPTGTIKLGNNSWNSFLNTITFGLFFKETQEFQISSYDALSGIDKVEYALSENNVMGEWTETNGIVSVNPERDFSINVRITDKAGNSRLINSEGIVLDTTPATIEGYAFGEIYELKAGKTYYLTQKIILNDNKLLDSLTINGEEIMIPDNHTIELSNISDGEKTIIVKDKAGNITEVIVKTGIFINDILTITSHTTSNDLVRLEDEVSRLNGFLSNNYDLSDVEQSLIRSTINELNETVEGIEELNAVMIEIEEIYETLPDINSVNSNNKASISELIETINRIIRENENHLTEEEKSRLNDILGNLVSELIWLNGIHNRIENIKTEVDRYSIETVNSDNKAALKTLKTRIAELKESHNLTNEEIVLLNEKEEKITALLGRIEEVERLLQELEEQDKPIENINKDNVTPEDQTLLENAQSGYVHALGVFDGNLSLSELFNINEAINNLNSALDILDQVAEFEAMVSELPDPSDVDNSYRFAIKAAQIAYSELSDYAKTLVGPSLLNKYKAVISAYQAFLDGSPLINALETLDVFWWAISTLLIVGVIIIATRRIRKRYSTIDSDKF